MRTNLFLATGLALLLTINGSAIAQQNCDRDCLRGMLDSYLEAVIANDPEAAPLVIGFRQTENAVNTRVGGGVWKTVTGLGDVSRYYLDEVSGQAGYYGTVMEGDETPIVTLRVLVENGMLTEGEWYIARADDPGMRGPRQAGGPPANLHNPDYLEQNPPPQRVVPASERVDRDTLERIAQSYFDALTSHDRTVAHAHEGCGRAENGSPAPGGQFLPPANTGAAPPPGQVPGGPSRDCLAGLEGFDMQMVVARRDPIIDVEAQVVLSLGVFIRRPGSTTPRLVFSEWFVVDDAKIRTVYTSMFYPPADLPVPNWPPLVGNWPLPAEIMP